IIKHNNVSPRVIVNIVCSATTDIKSEFPGFAARELGLVDVPIIDCQQMMRDGALEFRSRVMFTYNTDKTQTDHKHIN
ncbi:chorismate mutase, partial [Francisella tularensis]|uniref:chorismate mutase n=1 Tax=Francisella tularensis TaxID=263 RepID=UPI002381C1C7